MDISGRGKRVLWAGGRYQFTFALPAWRSMGIWSMSIFNPQPPYLSPFFFTEAFRSSAVLNSRELTKTDWY